MNGNWSRRGFLGGAGAGVLGAALPAAAAATSTTEAGSRQAEAGRKRPNIVIFMPDTLRADALACYGNMVAQTPNFDRMAREGTRFKNCYVQYPICGASRCSMLTGWPPSVRGHRSQSYYLRADEPNMFRDLRKAGYDVFWFGKNDALAADSFASSVTLWNQRDGQPIGGAEDPHTPGTGGTGRKDYRSDPTTFVGRGGGDPAKTSDFAYLQGAFDVLNGKHEKPFCIFLPLTTPHPPYAAPNGFHGKHDPAAIKGLTPIGVADKPGHLAAMRKAYHLEAEPEELYRQIRALYYDCVGYADWMLGQLLETIDQSGHREDTAVIVCSDHGDYAGDYGLVEKWPSGMEEQLTHVPLIVRAPGGVHGEVDDLVMLLDVMASCLDLAGTKADHTHFSRSVMPYVYGQKAEARTAVFTEGGYYTYEPQCFENEPEPSSIYYARINLQLTQPELVSRTAMVRTPAYKLVHRPAGVCEFYRLKDDPQELKNLYGAREVAQEQAELMQTLLNWYVSAMGIPPKDRDQRGAPAVEPIPKMAAVPAEFPFLRRD